MHMKKSTVAALSLSVAVMAALHGQSIAASSDADLSMDQNPFQMNELVACDKDKDKDHQKDDDEHKCGGDHKCGGAGCGGELH